jgi:predicted NAD/FAD-binding protein
MKNFRFILKTPWWLHLMRSALGLLMALGLAVLSTPGRAQPPKGVQNHDKNLKIAVIGGGVSGLTAAYTLKKKGYRHVTVFEKESRVGGKVQTIHYNGEAIELGAVIITNRYKTILNLARELDVPIRPAREVHYKFLNGKMLDSRDYILHKYSFLQMSQALLAYQWALIRFADIDKPGFVNLDPQLHQTLGRFSHKHGFFPVADALSPLMSGCGYGIYDEVPAMYWLKLMPFFTNLAVSNTLSGTHRDMMSFPEGFQSLLTAMARHLNVKLDAEVTRIKRTPREDHMQIAVTAKGTTETFDRVILATPLEYSHFFLELTPEEHDLFKRIVNVRYMVTLAQTNNREHATVVDNVTAQTRNHVNFLGQFNGNKSPSIFYQILDPDISEQTASSILESDLRSLGITINRILVQKIWSYFPHVKQKDLDEGFYEKLDSLQGINGTYYTGALLSFETAEHTAEHAEYLVNRFF